VSVQMFEKYIFTESDNILTFVYGAWKNIVIL